MRAASNLHMAGARTVEIVEAALEAARPVIEAETREQLVMDVSKAFATSGEAWQREMAHLRELEVRCPRDDWQRAYERAMNAMGYPKGYPPKGVTL